MVLKGRRQASAATVEAWQKSLSILNPGQRRCPHPIFCQRAELASFHNWDGEKAMAGKWWMKRFPKRWSSISTLPHRITDFSALIPECKRERRYRKDYLSKKTIALYSRVLLGLSIITIKQTIESIDTCLGIPHTCPEVGLPTQRFWVRNTWGIDRWDGLYALIRHTLKCERHEPVYENGESGYQPALTSVLLVAIMTSGKCHEEMLPHRLSFHLHAGKA